VSASNLYWEWLLTEKEDGILWPALCSALKIEQSKQAKEALIWLYELGCHHSVGQLDSILTLASL